MKKLTKAQVEEMTSLRVAYNDTGDALAQAIAEYNEAISELIGKVESALDEHKTSLANYREFRDGIVSEMEEYMSERSEKWAESDAGQSYEGWKSSWESVELEDPEIEMPEPIEEFDFQEDPFEEVETDFSQLI